MMHINIRATKHNGSWGTQNAWKDWPIITIPSAYQPKLNQEFFAMDNYHSGHFFFGISASTIQIRVNANESVPDGIMDLSAAYVAA